MCQPCKRQSIGQATCHLTFTTTVTKITHMVEQARENGPTQSERRITLQPGLHAYPIDLREQNEAVAFSDLRAPSVEDATTRLNELLQSIRNQGGKLIGIAPIEVSSRGGGRSLPKPETVPFFIIDKPEDI